MASIIKLECGCELTATCVLSMCMGHALQLQRQEAEDRKASDEFVRRCTTPETSAAPIDLLGTLKQQIQDGWCVICGGKDGEHKSGCQDGSEVL